jgi:hypothetical protein
VANDIAYFSVKSIGLSKIGGRKPCSLNDAARHNLREIQSELGAIGRIKPMQTIHNCVIAGSKSADSVVSTVKELIKAAGVDPSRKRRDYCQAIELLFSLPAESKIEPTQYFRKCLRWAESVYELPVLSAVVHLDESSPHCHVLLLPLSRKGHYLGSSPISRPETKKRVESFFAEVASPVGLKRQAAKMHGAVKTAAIKLVLDECCVNGLPAANGPLWPVFEAAIKKDPVPALDALNIDSETVRNAYMLESCVNLSGVGESKPYPV